MMQIVRLTDGLVPCTIESSAATGKHSRRLGLVLPCYTTAGDGVTLARQRC